MASASPWRWASWCTGSAALLTVLIGDTPPARRRGRATALSATAMFAGQFASPLVFGPLMGATAITMGYLAAGGLSLVILLTLLGVRVTAPGGDRTAAFA